MNTDTFITEKKEIVKQKNHENDKKNFFHLWQNIAKDFHGGNPGMCRMKALLRSHILAKDE